MKIVFFGTSDFAVWAIDALCWSKHKILGVVTAADKRKGRGRKIGFSPVKMLAQKKNLPIWQPRDLQDEKFLQILKKEPADLFVVCAYGKILTKEILQIPHIYAINLHASLLPKYRGAAPINWTIIKGEKQTGVTVFKMDECMDKGEIILQKKTAVSGSDTALSLGEKLSKIGAGALIEAIKLIEQKIVAFKTQDEHQASLAPKLRKEDGLIDWQSSAIEIHNRVRGLQLWPGAFTYLEDKLLKIWSSEVVASQKDAQVGVIVDLDSKKGILVQTGENKLLITALQLEGKKKMSAGEFILGHSIKAGMRLGNTK